MKVLILFAVIAACHAAGLLHHPVAYAPAVAIAEGGSSTQYRNQDIAGNYAFGYNEGHTSGGSFRKESGDAFGNKVGSYGLTDADGRVRVVNYVADGLGYRADISSNEPGVEPKDPAAATINKGGLVSAVAAHPVATAYTAGHPVAYAAGHPLAYGAANHLTYAAGYPGLYAGHHGLYAGHHGLYAGHHGLYPGHHGLYAGHYGLLGHYGYGPVGHYAYTAPGQVATASVNGAHHYSVKTHHLGGRNLW